MSSTTSTVRVGIETTDKKVFASALDWPGWCRAGRTEEAALAALAVYRVRYLPVARASASGEPVDGPLEVVQRLPGDTTSAFGAPSIRFDADRETVTGEVGARLASLVAASWEALAAIAADAPAQLRKGPRGGGRDRDPILAHVEDAHRAYLRPMGLRLPPAANATVAEMRAAMLDILREPSDGSPLPGAKWPQRYAARRVAWHALDHAWEIEDRSEP